MNVRNTVISLPVYGSSGSAKLICSLLVSRTLSDLSQSEILLVNVGARMLTSKMVERWQADDGPKVLQHCGVMRAISR
jgi:hypothetical protein